MHSCYRIAFILASCQVDQEAVSMKPPMPVVSDLLSFMYIMSARFAIDKVRAVYFYVRSYLRILYTRFTMTPSSIHRHPLIYKNPVGSINSLPNCLSLLRSSLVRVLLNVMMYVSLYALSVIKDISPLSLRLNLLSHAQCLRTTENV